MLYLLEYYREIPVARSYRIIGLISTTYLNNYHSSRAEALQSTFLFLSSKRRGIIIIFFGAKKMKQKKHSPLPNHPPGDGLIDFGLRPSSRSSCIARKLSPYGRAIRFYSLREKKCNETKPENLKNGENGSQRQRERFSSLLRTVLV